MNPPPDKPEIHDVEPGIEPGDDPGGDLSPAGLRGLANVRVVLSRPSHPGNIGACARAMKTMGLTSLYLVCPQRFPHAEAVARAANAGDVLAAARVCATLDEALEGVTLTAALSARRREHHPPLLNPREAAAELAVTALTQPVALLFGNETWGLHREEVDRCQRLVLIPTDPACKSLNLASAVQVLAYELRLAACGAQTPVTPAPVFPAHEALEHFYADLEALLVRVAFLDPAQPRRLMSRLRRLYARADLERDELNILQGVNSAVRRALDRGAD